MKSTSLPLLLSTGLTLIGLHTFRVFFFNSQSVTTTPSDYYDDKSNNANITVSINSNNNAFHHEPTIEQMLEAAESTAQQQQQQQETGQISTDNPHHENQQQEQQQEQQLRQDLSLPTIDILSIGSSRPSRQPLQAAQEETFGSHRAVRYFYRGTEQDDWHKCHLRLTPPNVERVSVFCRNRDTKQAYPILYRMAPHFVSSKYLMKKANPAGWLCAQKRPFDAFLRMIGKYHYRKSLQQFRRARDEQQQQEQMLPDYLLVLDDDTWINLEHLIRFLPRRYPAERAHVVAGCLIVAKTFDFTLPFGGYGIIFTRPALENLLQPLYCGASRTFDHQDTTTTTTTTTNDIDVLAPPQQTKYIQDETEFERLACWRLQQNGIGERDLFRDGMSIADLMHTYATAQNFVQIKAWNETSPGFCLHSDWAWAYFVNYYHIAQPPDRPTFVNRTRIGFASTSSSAAVVVQKATDFRHDRLVGYNDSQVRPWHEAPMAKKERLRQCQNGNDLYRERLGKHNGNDFCKYSAHMCHRITPDHMRLLHNWNRVRFPQHYHQKNMNGNSNDENGNEADVDNGEP
ncbi:hypothetical protein ACA910_021817 [Epithemia clementina (nom. ined.)]